MGSTNRASDALKAAAEGVPRLRPAADCCILVEFGDGIDERTNQRVIAYDEWLAAAGIPGVVETVPSYRSVLVVYDPERIRFAELARLLLAAAPKQAGARHDKRRWHVPVTYGGEFGVDLDQVARAVDLSTEEVAQLHSAAEYQIYMIGFAPGFAYLGGIPERLHLPRRRDPRLRTPAGTVSIGGKQGAITSVELPSGWHLLGRTPVRGFDPGREPAFLFSAGDHVRFHAIPPSEFDRLDRLAAGGQIVAGWEPLS